MSDKKNTMSDKKSNELQEDEVVDVSRLSNEKKGAFCLAPCPTPGCNGVCGKRKVHPGRHRCFAGHSW